MQISKGNLSEGTGSTRGGAVAFCTGLALVLGWWFPGLSTAAVIYMAPRQRVKMRTRLAGLLACWLARTSLFFGACIVRSHSHCHTSLLRILNSHCCIGVQLDLPLYPEGRTAANDAFIPSSHSLDPRPMKKFAKSVTQTWYLLPYLPYICLRG